MDYRTTRSAYLNCEKRIFSGIGEYNIPEMRPVEDMDLEGYEALGFNYAVGCKHPERYVLHFHLDDYQFERVWNDPNRYLPLLSKFKAVLAPDFSTYEDFPEAVQIFNTYRKMWCAAYWQEHGITVIPTLNWDTNPEHIWYFDGIPKNSLVSVSTVGGFKSKATKERWLEGFRRTLDTLQPSKILVFGKLWSEVEESFDGEFITMDNRNLTRKATLSKHSTKNEEDVKDVSEERTD